MHGSTQWSYEMILWNDLNRHVRSAEQGGDDSSIKTSIKIISREAKWQGRQIRRTVKHKASISPRTLAGEAESVTDRKESEESLKYTLQRRCGAESPETLSEALRLRGAASELEPPWWKCVPEYINYTGSKWGEEENVLRHSRKTNWRTDVNEAWFPWRSQLIITMRRISLKIK